MRLLGEAEPAFGHRVRRGLALGGRLRRSPALGVGRGGVYTSGVGRGRVLLLAVGRGEAWPRTSGEADPALSPQARWNQTPVVRARSAAVLLAVREFLMFGGY